MWKTSIFADLSTPTENKSTNSMYKHQLASLGSNQEWFEESNPQGLQGPACIVEYRIRLPLLLLNIPRICHLICPSINQPTVHHVCCPHHQWSNHQLLKYSATQAQSICNLPIILLLMCYPLLNFSIQPPLLVDVFVLLSITLNSISAATLLLLFNSP